MQDQVHSWYPSDSKHKWIDKHDICSYICDYSKIMEMQTKIESIMSVLAHEDKTNAHFTEFVNMKLVSLVWRGNVLETGMGNESATQIHIKNTVDNHAANDSVVANTAESLTRFHSSASWDAEGIRGFFDVSCQQQGWKSMGDQAVMAYGWLQMLSVNASQSLTVQDIKNAHQILMSGGMADCGQFRTDSAMAGDYVFAHFSDIESRMTDLVDRFNADVKDVTSYPITVSIQFMLDFVTIHPFRNGNGRMCRLLFSFALQKMGFPFPVTLDSGYSKTYKHYVNALKMAQGRSKNGPLLQLGIISIYATLMNYVTYSNNPKLKDI